DVEMLAGGQRLGLHVFSAGRHHAEEQRGRGNEEGFCDHEWMMWWSMEWRSGSRVLHAMGIAGVQRLAADAPGAFLVFVDLDPGHVAERFSFDRDHRVGDPGDDLFLLFGREHVFDDLYVYEWHCAFGLWFVICAGTNVPFACPLYRCHRLRSTT